jgi:hypothetical protein
MDFLKEAAVPGAFHNSLQRSDPPKCHKHTREAILDKIMEWVRKKIDTDTFIMWLYGAAGAGKSAIAQTIAELCEEHKLLLASFFSPAPTPCVAIPSNSLLPSPTRLPLSSQVFEDLWKLRSTMTLTFFPEHL